MEWYHVFVFIIMVILAILYIRLQNTKQYVGGEPTKEDDYEIEEYNIIDAADPLAAHNAGMYIIGHIMAPQEEFSAFESYFQTYAPGVFVVNIGDIIQKKGVRTASKILKDSLKIFHHQPIVIFGKNYEIDGKKIHWIKIPGIRLFHYQLPIYILRQMKKTTSLKTAIDKIEDNNKLENFYDQHYYGIHTDSDRIVNIIYWFNINCQMNMSVIKPSLRIPHKSTYATFLFYILQQATIRGPQIVDKLKTICGDLDSPERELAEHAIKTGELMRAAPLWDNLDIFPANKYKDKFVFNMQIPEKILQDIVGLIDNLWTRRPEIFWIIGASGSGKSTLMKQLQFDEVEVVDVDKYDDEISLNVNKIENCPQEKECTWNGITTEKINREYQLIFNCKKPKIVFVGTSTELIGAADHLLFLDTPAELNYVRKNIRELNTLCDNKDKWTNILLNSNPNTMGIEMGRATIINEYRGLSLYRRDLIDGINNYKKRSEAKGFLLMSSDEIIKYITKS